MLRTMGIYYNVDSYGFILGEYCQMLRITGGESCLDTAHHISIHHDVDTREAGFSGECCPSIAHERP
jgi:hypothetical protein